MEVNIKAYHIIYGMSHDFNPKGHNITYNIYIQILFKFKNLNLKIN